MTATVRLDDTLEKTLISLSDTLHKKKSDVIRDAIVFYAQNVQKSKKRRILEAVAKTAKADKIESDFLDGTVDDGL